MDFKLPELGEGVYEAEFIAWKVQVGDTVKRGQSLMEVMTDKATMEVPSPFAGTITGLRFESGQQVKVGDVALTYDADVSARGREETEAATSANGGKRPQRPPAPSRDLAVATASRSRVTVSPESVKAAPSVRLMARKLGIDLARLHGSGPGGRVLVEDLAGQMPATRVAAPQPATPAPDYGRPGTRIKLQGLRRKIAEHLELAKRNVVPYSYVDECDVTDLVRLREAFKEPYAQRGVKLTYLAFFVKATAEALKEVPIINSSLDESANEIVLHASYHIGVAVATPAGLIVPVVRDADRKGMAQIARDIERLSAEARSGKTKLEDLRGGTFTVTSVGNIGGLISTPVINHPEVGILGIGKVVRRPTYDTAGAIHPADIVYLSFSFDHRVVDGAVGAAFGNAIIRRLHKPAELFMPE
jgi:pyruvate dehydrogenase E2 component (dihydrolipoamide acetyltransferase)/2-oxoisovalerate dehydrogenase E2 component (dihydrolipoyl transacylase)